MPHRSLANSSKDDQRKKSSHDGRHRPRSRSRSNDRGKILVESDQRRHKHYYRGEEKRDQPARHRHRARHSDTCRSDDKTERRYHDENRRHKHEQRKDGVETNKFTFGKTTDKVVKQEKEKPNLEVSGKLAEETNTYKGIEIKYAEPPEARIPKKRWRLYPFKGEESLKVMHIHRQSAFLLGRDRRVADIPIDHPSCSKQHAVLQYRLVNYTRKNGTEGRHVRPYIIDLGAANGTFLNGKQIDPKRYYELMEKDVIKFGFSSREYVVLTDGADTSELEPQDSVL